MDTFRIEYQELSEEQKANIKNVKIVAAQMLGTFEYVPADERSERSRCMALARTKLEEAVMWAVKGISYVSEK